MPSPECEQEFEVLESIYKEIEIIPETTDGGSLVSILLYPKSAGDTEARYVTVKLELHLSGTYPITLPKVEIRNPRGLNQEQLLEIENMLDKMKNEFIGSPMLFQLIDYVQDYLTLNNRPSSECPICLTLFTDSDVFYTPMCFHHYHSHCLGLHLQSLVSVKESADSNSQVSNEILCPVCRVALDPQIDVAKLLASPPAIDEETTASVSIPQNDRHKLDALFKKQKDQGGIIDLAEDCIRLLRISEHVLPTVGDLPQGHAPVDQESADSGIRIVRRNVPERSRGPLAQGRSEERRSAQPGWEFKTTQNHQRKPHRGGSSRGSRNSNDGGFSNHWRHHPGGGRSQHPLMLAQSKGLEGEARVASDTSRRKQPHM